MAIAQLSIDIEARLANFEQQLGKVSASAEGMANRLKTSFSNLGGYIGAALGAVAAAGAVGQFKELVNYLDQMDEAAERIGTSSSNLSALAYSAKLSGLEFEDLNKGLVKFSGTLADAAAGNKDAIELLNRLGVSASNYDDLNAALEQTADKFSTLKDGVGKTALASDAFGDKLGSKMVPMLNQGAAGMAEMRKEAEKLGGIIDDKLAKQAADFNDNLDRLATLSSAAGKSIASGLLPWLNEAAESFLIARKHSESFWDTLNKKIPSLQIIDVANELARVRGEYEQIDYRISNGKAKAGDEERLASLGKELAYYEELNSAKNKQDEPRRTGDVTPKSQGGGKKERESKSGFTDYDAILTERISKAIGDTDLVKAEELEATLAKLDQLASAGLDPAIVQAIRDDLTGATKEAADEAARLNSLLGATESGQIASATKDMQLLAKSLEAGRISEEQYLEAVQTRLDKNGESLEKNKSLAEELGLTFTSAFEDAVANGGNFSSVLKGLEQDLIRLIMRLTVTEPLLKAFKDAGGVSGLFSSLGSMFSSSGSSAGGGLAFADGGVFLNSPSLSTYSGTVVSQPTRFFADGGNVMGEAGPEGIFPLKRGKDGKLGVAASGGGGVVVNVINNAGAETSTKKRSDGQGGSIIDVFIEQAKNAIAGDIASGNGSVPAAMSSAYGIKRTAGAY